MKHSILLKKINFYFLINLFLVTLVIISSGTVYADLVSPYEEELTKEMTRDQQDKTKLKKIYQEVLLDKHITLYNRYAYRNYLKKLLIKQKALIISTEKKLAEYKKYDDEWEKSNMKN